MGQQAPLTPTGAGQAAGGQASTKQVICPSCRRDGARTLSPWPATARPSLPGWLLGQAVTGAYSRVPSEPRPLPPTPRRPGGRGPSHSSTLGPRWRPLALTERRLDQGAAARARPVLRPPHPGGTCPAPGCRDGARAGPPPPGAPHSPPSPGPGAPGRRGARAARGRAQAALTWHSQRVQASCCHPAPSGCVCPSVSLHPAVPSRDSSFWIYKAKRTWPLVVASLPSRPLPCRTRRGRRGGDGWL